MIVSGCERFYEYVYRQKSAIKDIGYKALGAIEQKSLSKALSELQETIIKLESTCQIRNAVLANTFFAPTCCKKYIFKY